MRVFKVNVFIPLLPVSDTIDVLGYAINDVSLCSTCTAFRTIELHLKCLTNDSSFSKDR